MIKINTTPPQVASEGRPDWAALYPGIYDSQLQEQQDSQERASAGVLARYELGYLDKRQTSISGCLLEAPVDLYSVDGRFTSQRSARSDLSIGQIADRSKPCQGFWEVRHCECESQPVWVDGCGRRACPMCGFSKAKSSAGRVLRRLLDAREYRFQFLVLTVPPSLRERYMNNEEGAKLWSGHVRTWIKWAKKNLGLKYAYLRTHPCGDDGRYFAPHANLIFAQDKALPGWRPGQLPLERIRAAWAQILGYEGEVNIHAQFVDSRGVEGRKRLAHHVRYIDRHFPGWHWRGQASRWYGKAPKLLETDEKRGHCPVCDGEYWYALPAGAELLAVAVLSTYLETGQPPPLDLDVTGPPGLPPERVGIRHKKIRLDTVRMFETGVCSGLSCSAVTCR